MTRREAIRRALTAPQTFFWPQQVIGSVPIWRETRSAWMRLQNILALLKTGELFNCKTIAAATNTCTKTIHRDVTYLRRQGVKINWIVAKRAYQLDKTFPLPPQFQVTGGIA